LNVAKVFKVNSSVQLEYCFVSLGTYTCRFCDFVWPTWNGRGVPLLKKLAL